MKKLTSNIAFLMSEKVIVLLIGLLSNVVVIRYLGVEDFGNLALFQVYYALIVSITEFGLRRVYSSLQSVKREKLVFLQTLKIKILISFIFSLVVVSFIGLRGDETYYYWLLLAVLASPLELYVYHFEANLKNDLLVKIRVTVAIALAILRIALCLLKADLYLIAISFALNNLIINIICCFMVTRRDNFLVKIKSNSAKKVITKHIFERSFFFWVSMVIVQVNMRTDQLMLSSIATVAQVGIYAGAYKLIEQLMAVPSILSSVFLPYISKNKEINKDDYLTKLYAFIIFTTLIISVPAVLCAPYIIPLLLGNGFEASVPVFQILCLSFPFLALANISGLYYSLNMLEKFAVFRNACGLGSSLLLNYIFIKEFGTNGAAFSVMISYFLISFVYEYALKQTRKNAVMKLKAVKFIFTPYFYSELRSLVKPR
ncbi:TPA: flippase [Klebsiella variicola]|nr:flippase [Klebsiella variicola]HCI6001610.1 flippase [Klebsiella variicola subsp. variicola]